MQYIVYTKDDRAVTSADTLEQATAKKEELEKHLKGFAPFAIRKQEINL